MSVRLQFKGMPGPEPLKLSPEQAFTLRFPSFGSKMPARPTLASIRAEMRAKQGGWDLKADFPSMADAQGHRERELLDQRLREWNQQLVSENRIINSELERLTNV
jgi:hypothetical protein